MNSLAMLETNEIQSSLKPESIYFYRKCEGKQNSPQQLTLQSDNTSVNLTNERIKAWNATTASKKACSMINTLLMNQ